MPKCQICNKDKPEVEEFLGIVGCKDCNMKDFTRIKTREITKRGTGEW